MEEYIKNELDGLKVRYNNGKIPLEYAIERAFDLGKCLIKWEVEKFAKKICPNLKDETQCIESYRANPFQDVL